MHKCKFQQSVVVEELILVYIEVQQVVAKK